MRIDRFLLQEIGKLPFSSSQRLAAFFADWTAASMVIG
jgi:hypothetical protein